MGGQTVLKTFYITDVGKKRKLNEDAVYTSEMPVGNLPNLFLVADGMGGHNAGDYASRYTVEMMVSDIEANKETDPKEILRHAIGRANEFVYERACERPAMSGMGTTIVAAVCLGDELLVANVGDSRLYLINETIKQITRKWSGLAALTEARQEIIPIRISLRVRSASKSGWRLIFSVLH